VPFNNLPFQLANQSSLRLTNLSNAIPFFDVVPEQHAKFCGRRTSSDIAGFAKLFLGAAFASPVFMSMLTLRRISEGVVAGTNRTCRAKAFKAQGFTARNVRSDGHIPIGSVIRELSNTFHIYRHPFVSIGCPLPGYLDNFDGSRSTKMHLAPSSASPEKQISSPSALGSAT
jgi:hypothetical protein